MRLIDADALEKAIYKWMPKDMETWADSSIPPIENLVVSIMMTIEEQPTINQWIPCSEILPMNLVLVLVTYIDEDVNYPTVDIGYHTSRGFCDRDFNIIDDVLAWMPLPKPYEVEEK